MRRAIFSLSGLLVCAAACESPPYDRFPKGNAPDLLGVIEGSVNYLGPPPTCLWDPPSPVGTPAGIKGRVVLTLFAYDNPPPPEGTATTALSLLSVPGRDLFEFADCRPEGADPTTLNPINRSVAFVWPQIKMGAEYRINGFYDDDADFVPFFGVRKTSTAGDVVGGAFENPAAVPLKYQQIRFGEPEDHPQGETVIGVQVNLALRVMTAPPLFRLGDDAMPLSSQTLITSPPDLTPDPTDTLVDWEAAFFATAEARLTTIEEDRTGYEAAMAAAGLAGFSFADEEYAWYVRDVDIDPVDGAADDHPVLGSAGIKYHYPIVIFSRARTPAELGAGVPAVSFVAALRPVATAVMKVFKPEIDLLIPPIAVVDLDPTAAECRVPYIPPDNATIAYEGLPAKDCQELPTGRYNISVLHGVAGAGLNGNIDASISQTTYNLAGGTGSGQSWTIPNELGPPDSDYNPTAQPQLASGLALEEQGPAGRYVVFEADETNEVRHDCDTAIDPVLFLQGLADGMTPQAAAVAATRQVDYEAVPANCCAAVAHLCGLPLCPVKTTSYGASTDLKIREVTEANAEGAIACLPFLMPASCCAEE